MQDVATLGVVNVRYCGYVAVVKVQERENTKVSPLFQSIELEQHEGGANALNINRFDYKPCYGLTLSSNITEGLCEISTII